MKIERFSAARCSTALGRGESEHRLALYFVRSSGALLLITGLAKIFSFFGNTRVLEIRDPLIGLPLGTVILIVGLVELALAYLCLSSKRLGACAGMVAWLATNFIMYRLGLWFIGWHKPRACLGSLTDMLHISPGTADNIMKAVLTFLFVGAYSVMLLNLVTGRRKASS